MAIGLVFDLIDMLPMKEPFGYDLSTLLPQVRHVRVIRIWIRIRSSCAVKLKFVGTARAKDAVPGFPFTAYLAPAGISFPGVHVSLVRYVLFLDDSRSVSRNCHDPPFDAPTVR